MSKVIKQDNPRPHPGHRKRRRYEVQFITLPGRPWETWSTNGTKIGAYIDYWLRPAGTSARIIDHGKDWRNGHMRG